MELFVKGVKFSTYFRRYHPIITIIITVLGLTLAGVAVTLVAGEAGALVAADVVGAVREHITGSENVTMSHSGGHVISAVFSSPVFAFIFVRHGTSLAAPAVIAVTLGV